MLSCLCMPSRPDLGVNGDFCQGEGGGETEGGKRGGTVVVV